MKFRSLGANQTVVVFNDTTEAFFSYSTPVAMFIPGRGYIRTKKKFSSTTSGHINRYLGETARGEVEQSGIERLVAEK